MRQFLIALQFLTVFPVRLKTPPGDTEFRQSVVCYPIIGLLIGLFLGGANYLLRLVFPVNIVPVCVLVFLIWITGGLHLDGLADTFDGLAGGKNREEILEIMHDSRIGAIGVLAIVCCVLLKWQFLDSLSIRAGKILVLMPVLSRWAVIPAIAVSESARTHGFGRSVADVGIVELVIGTLFAVVAGFCLAGYVALCLMAAICVAVFLICLYFRLKLGGITGDVLGAIIEISELIVLAGYLISAPAIINI